MFVDLLVKNLLRFLLVVAIQFLLLNNILITQWGIIPMWYIIFIILLPFETPSWVALVFGFIIGLLLDTISNTQGAHSFATTFMAFVRPFILGMLAPRDGYETGQAPLIGYMGLYWFAKYAIILIFMHQISFYMIEAFSFSYFSVTLFKIVLGTLVSIFVVVISQFFVFRK